MTVKQSLKLIILFILTLIVFLADIFTGSVSVPVSEILKILFTGSSSSELWKEIILNLRLPSSTAALMGGAALSLAGLDMQTFFRNPLAGPYVLGIGSGASLGAAVVIMSGITGFAGRSASAVSAVAGAFAVTFVLILVLKKYRNITVLLVTGLLAGYFINSIVTILIRFSRHSSVRSYINWTMGSFKNITWESMFFLIPVITAVFIFHIFLVKQLDLYLLGENYASSMGVNKKYFRYSILISTSLLTGAVTSVCGPVSFIGIAAPHFCRNFMKTSRHSIIIPAALLSGSIAALSADIISSVPGWSLISQSGIIPDGVKTLPLNAVTAVIGVPFVLKVLFRETVHHE